MLCSFSGVEQLMVNYHTGSRMLSTLGGQISDYPPASGSRTALTQNPPYHVFFVASFSEILSASYWSHLFSL